MKTPREILLARHQEAEAALDAVRKDALKTITARVGVKDETTGSVSIFAVFCQELFLPARRIWIGLASCWAIILVLHFVGGDTQPAVAKTTPAPTPEMLAALRPQRQLLAELLSGDTKQTDADQPRRSRPSPHSEIHRMSALA